MSSGRDQQRLLAVMIADVVGYSRLMAADERDTFERLQHIQRSLLRPTVLHYGGEMIKTTGDGFIATFPTAVDAVRAAADIQRVVGRIGMSEPDDTRIVFRIGVNAGDVILSENDVFGDAVNIAARLEGLATPGGIAVTRGVRDAVRNRDLTFESCGAHKVKNIAEPVEVYAVHFNLDAAPADLKPLSTVPLPVVDNATERGLRVKPLTAGIAAAAIMLIGGFTYAITAQFWPKASPRVAAGSGPANSVLSKPGSSAANVALRADAADGSESEDGPSQLVTTQGKEIRIGRSWQVNPQNCESANLPDITLSKPPVSGRIDVRPVEFVIRRREHPCYGKAVKGADLFYVPGAEFVGTESLTYRVRVGRTSREHNLSISTRAP